MSVNLFAVNVGNTRSQFAAFVDGRLHDVYHVAHRDRDRMLEQLEQAHAPLSGIRDVPAYIASVHGEAAEVVGRDVARLTRRPIVRVESEVPVPIGRQLDPETRVGVDRLLNAAAAYDQLKQGCIVIDAGTAVTVDFIDGAGTFHGGAILPGARMMLTAMDEHTAQLPAVEFKAPDEPIGHNTAEAMLSGVFHGIRGAVRELTEMFAEQYGTYPPVIATGGDAELLFGEYELIESIVPELTLHGMAVTRRHQLSESEDAG